LDEVFIRTNGERQQLWRAVDQDGDVIDILVQPSRDQRAAERFFRRLLRGLKIQPLRIIADKLRSYSVAMRTILSDVNHLRNSTPTIVPKFRISRRVKESGKCADPNLLGKPNGFYVVT